MRGPTCIFWASLTPFLLLCQYNCMQNAKTRCAAGDLDAIVHMGDHAYDMGMLLIVAHGQCDV